MSDEEKKLGAVVGFVKLTAKDTEGVERRARIAAEKKRNAQPFNTIRGLAPLALNSKHGKHARAETWRDRCDHSPECASESECLALDANT